MTPLSSVQLFSALEGSWPPARKLRSGPFLLRAGAGGGKRVSAATAEAPVTPDAIHSACDDMRTLGQTPLFMVPRDDRDLDSLLEAEGLEVIDPVACYLTQPGTLTDSTLNRLAAIACSEPLAIQVEIWAAGGIGSGRLAVMERASRPKAYLLGRVGDRPAGTAFISICDGFAMLHALEVRSNCRRRGVARALMTGAANWALHQGAEYLGVLVTQANAQATALYTSLGMPPVEGYHYRIAPDRIHR